MMTFLALQTKQPKKFQTKRLPIAQKVPKTTWKQAVREIYQESLKQNIEGQSILLIENFNMKLSDIC